MAATGAQRFVAERWIWSVVGRRAWKVALLCVLQAALAGLGIAFALVMRQVIDVAVAGAADAFVRSAAVLVAVVAVQLALRALLRWASEDARATVENALRGRTFEGILAEGRGGAGDRDGSAAHHSGDLMSRLTSDVSVVTEGVTQFVPTVVSMAVRIVGALAVLFSLVPVIAWAFVAAGACMGLASVALRPRLKRLHRGVQEAESNVRSFLQECLESLLVVRAFGREDKMASINQENMEAHRRARMRRCALSNACNVGVGLAVQGSYLLGFLWCGWGILEGTVSYGTLMAAVQLIGQIQSPFASMGSTFSQWSAMLASAERLMEVAGREGRCAGSRPAAAAAPSPSPDELRAGLSALCLEDVSFGYGREAVLSSVSLSVTRGEFVALAGPSGVGKSTVIKLLMGAEVPEAGRVTLRLQDGRAVAAAEAPAGLFAFVPQGNLLMSGTIRDVVSFADEAGAPADEARLVEACRAACADEFIAELPQGLDTPLGERGAGLSEGQMQRLAVARAVYSGAPVLLLDEATSALDAGTEERMLGRLRRLPDRTAVVVTHRAEAMVVCDRVVRISRAGEGGGAGAGAGPAAPAVAPVPAVPAAGEGRPR